MKRSFTVFPAVIFSCILLIIVSSGCGIRPFGRPHGEFVASCAGDVELSGRGKTKFAFDVYRDRDDEYKAYFSLPRRGLRYRPVKDISFDDGVFRVELESPRRVYEGRIVGDDLKFKGHWNGFSGTLNIDVDD